MSTPDYAASVRVNRWGAKMMRLRGDETAAQAHDNLADLYTGSVFSVAAKAALDQDDPATERRIELTFVDADDNTFVPLIAFVFPDAATHDLAWESIPAGPSGSAYLADRHEPDGIVEAREVSVEWIERITGRQIEDLKARGREHVVALQGEVKALMLS